MTNNEPPHSRSPNRTAGADLPTPRLLAVLLLGALFSPILAGMVYLGSRSLMTGLGHTDRAAGAPAIAMGFLVLASVVLLCAIYFVGLARVIVSGKTAERAKKERTWLSVQTSIRIPPRLRAIAATLSLPFLLALVIGQGALLVGLIKATPHLMNTMLSPWISAPLLGLAMLLLGVSTLGGIIAAAALVRWGLASQHLAASSQADSDDKIAKRT